MRYCLCMEALTNHNTAVTCIFVLRAMIPPAIVPSKVHESKYSIYIVLKIFFIGAKINLSSKEL